MYRQLLIEKWKEPNYINNVGDMIWYNENAEIHSIRDRPAIILSNGKCFWCKNGVIHRNGDKPAVIYANGERAWYKNGKFIKRKIK